MKTTLIALLIILSHLSFAKTTVPLCNLENETEVYPCRLPQSEATEAVMNMMIHNTKGMKLVKSSGEIGLMVSDFDDSEYFTVTMMNFEFEEELKLVMKYEIRLYDGHGTDTIDGPYLWTVIETTIGDGYTYQARYKNEIKRIIVE